MSQSASGTPGMAASNAGPIGKSTVKRPIPFPFCDDVSKYEKLAKVGQGTFGEVTKARDRKTKGLVALKKVFMENEKEGFPLTALREVKILAQLNHENIVHLIEICRSKPNPYGRGNAIHLVFEFCEHDLSGLLSNSSFKLTLSETKSLMQMLLNALFFLHKHRILHRDVKAANILVTKTGILKLADFGLARAFSPKNEKQRYTSRVVTLWYRSPELLLGERDYGPPIDMWGVGCIMAEMWVRAPILQGRTEQHQLSIICNLCGSINEATYKGCTELPLYSKIQLPSGLKRKVRERLTTYVKDPPGLELIDRLLALNPNERISANDSLNHDFFWSDPLPTPLATVMGTLQSSHFEFTAPRRNGAGHMPLHGGPPPSMRPQGAVPTASSMPAPDYATAQYDHVY